MRSREIIETTGLVVRGIEGGCDGAFSDKVVNRQDAWHDAWELGRRWIWEGYCTMCTGT
jgi:hypothetical protein